MKEKFLRIKGFQYTSRCKYPNRIVQLEIKGNNLEELENMFKDQLVYDDQSIFTEGLSDLPDYDLLELKWREASSSIEVEYRNLIKITPLPDEPIDLMGYYGC